MTLETAHTWHELALADPFEISRGTTTVSENAVVRIEDGAGHVGIGGAVPAAYYDESRERLDRALDAMLAVVERVDDPHNVQRIEAGLRDATDHPQRAARSAVTIALADLVSKRADLPLYRWLGLDPAETVTTSYSIGLADTDRMAERASDLVAAGYPSLKVKLGTDRDREIVAAIREAAPDARLRVDANEAWDPDTAIEMCAFLGAQNVEFVEQPVPASDPDGMARVRDASDLPIAADERCVTLADLPVVADCADIAVVKLSKCGGPFEAVRQIHAARAHDLEVMLGCRVESNTAIAAGAHLAPLADYADLDGSLLLAADPFAGVPMPEGWIDLATVDRPGTGGRERDR
jgi:L-alanine-DL-glutamate epimerase-like enolase superfamily enzyme